MIQDLRIKLFAEKHRYVQDRPLMRVQIPYDKHHKVSSLVKSHQNTHNSVKYEVI